MLLEGCGDKERVGLECWVRYLVLVFCEWDVSSGGKNVLRGEAGAEIDWEIRGLGILCRVCAVLVVGDGVLIFRRRFSFLYLAIFGAELVKTGGRIVNA